MPATEVPLDCLQHAKREHQSAFLFIFAGCLVIAGTCAAVLGWGTNIHVPLSLIFIALILSIGAMARYSGGESSAKPVPHSTRHLWLIFATLVLIHGFLAILLLKSIPGETIDTFTFQRDTCKSLLQGVDPFGGTHVNLYDSYHTTLFYGSGMVVNGQVQVGFQYPPLTLLWVLPGYLLGDVRYSYILAVVLSAFFSLAICPNTRNLWIVSVLLLSPLTFWVENRCWTEPLVLMALCVTVYAAVKQRWWLPIILGLFLATKQYNFLALPFFGCFIRPFQWKGYWKLVGWSTAVAAATVLPFACWNFRALWHDLVLFHLAQPFRQDAISFAVLFPIMLKIGPVFLVVFIAWAARTVTRNAAMFAAEYGVSLLLFVATNKQAFANYYFLVGQALLLAAATLPCFSFNSTEQRKMTS